MIHPARAVCGALALLATAAHTPAEAAEVNVYTTREPGLIRPLLDAYTRQTGTKVNAVFVQAGLAERVAAEGANSPADVLMTVDIGNLVDLVKRDLAQPVRSESRRSASMGAVAKSEGSLA